MRLCYVCMYLLTGPGMGVHWWWGGVVQYLGWCGILWCDVMTYVMQCGVVLFCYGAWLRGMLRFGV